MAKILILAQSGFGKSSSIGAIAEFGHLGLNSKETYIISATSKPLPFRGQSTLYKVTTPDKIQEGNRIITNDGNVIGDILTALSKSPYKNIILEDSNYIMQDYYMANSLKKGYETFKEIGFFMGKIFSAAESLRPDQHFIMMAHFEEYKDSNNDTISYRFKTVGKMVQDYTTPEGKFDIVMFGKQTFDGESKVISKQFVTNFDGQYPSKTPIGMFKETYIPNDLGMVINIVNEYYK